MSRKLTLALLVATVGLLYACQPDFKAFQMANVNRPCTQCGEIIVAKGCSSDMHNKSFDCATPSIAYSLSFSEKPCARATITCAGKAGVTQSSAVVAQLKSNSSEVIYGAISTLQPQTANLVLKCNSEKQWIVNDLDDNELTTPLTVQCAHNQPDAVINTLAL